MSAYQLLNPRPVVLNSGYLIGFDILDGQYFVSEYTKLSDELAEEMSKDTDGLLSKNTIKIGVFELQQRLKAGAKNYA